MWAQIDVERAQEELRSLFAHQSSSGQLPQIVLWDSELVSRRSWHHVEAQGRLDWLLGRKPWTSVQIQPPVIAQAVEAIVDAGAAELLTEALPALERHYRFLAEHRDPDGDGLISIISQYESGLDFSPVFDAAPGEGPPVPVPSYLRARLTQLRNKLLGYDHPGRVFRWSPRHHEDVLVNAIYADGLDALARLAARAGSHTLEAWARDQAATVLEALVERCYDERRGFFFNLAGRGEHRIDGVLKVGGSSRSCSRAFRGSPQDGSPSTSPTLAGFWTAYPVPSVAVDEPSFVPDSRPSGRRRIWRCPCSMNTNWLLSSGCGATAAPTSRRSSPGAAESSSGPAASTSSTTRCREHLSARLPSAGRRSRLFSDSPADEDRNGSQSHTPDRLVAMASVHEAVGVAVIAVCAGAAVLGFVAYRRGSGAGAIVSHALALAQTLLVGQAALGLLLVSDGHRAPDKLHYAYGAFALGVVLSPWFYAPAVGPKRLLWFAGTTLLAGALAVRAFMTGT